MAPIYKRRYLAGSVLNEPTPVVWPPVVEPPIEPQAIPEPAQNKGGRPKKYESDNARKLAHKKSKQEPERQRMIERILARVQKHMSKPSTAHADSTFWKVVQQNKDWLKMLRQNLDGCTYVQIKNYYNVLVSKKGIGDMTGQLPGERSGEAPQSGGMSELERVIAAMWDTTTDEVSAPVKHGSHDVDWEVKAAESIAEEEWKGSGVYELKKIESKDALVEHILASARQGEKSTEIAQLVQMLPQGEGAPLRFASGSRYRTELYFRVKELVKADKKKGAKARRMARLAKKQGVSSPSVKTA